MIRAERVHLDAVAAAWDVMFWRGAAGRASTPALRRRMLRHARAAEVVVVDLAVAIEARLRREQTRGGVVSEKPRPF